MVDANQIEAIVKKVKECATKVYEELGGGWNETIYQKAMEVALRTINLPYETQRILPITYSGFVVGESIPDLVVWVEEKSRRTGIVIDLKWESGIKEEHSSQVMKYIQELKKQVKGNESVYPNGYVINFTKNATSVKVSEEMLESSGGVQILEVNHK